MKKLVEIFIMEKNNVLLRLNKIKKNIVYE